MNIRETIVILFGVGVSFLLLLGKLSGDIVSVEFINFESCVAGFLRIVDRFVIADRNNQ